MSNTLLAPRQARFVDEYLIDLNATQAAIRAGYSAKSAVSKASQLLTIVNIQAAIQLATEERSRRTEVDADWVIENLRLVVEQAMAAAPILDKNGEATGLYTFNGQVANRALELLGKHLGMFPDRAPLVNVDNRALTVQVVYDA